MKRIPCDPVTGVLRRAIIFSLLSLVGAGGINASDTWRSVLFPETWQPPNESYSFYTDKLIQDFSYAGYRRSEVPIPSITGPVFNVMDHGADPTGASDSTMAIQAAINAAAAAGGGVVFLPAGEFRVRPQGSNNFALRISTSNIVLRGAGVGQTFILNTSFQMRGNAVIQISPTSSSTGPEVAITADLPGPTRRIPVANAAAFSPGDFVRMFWTFTPAWIAEHQQQSFWNANARPDDARYFREVLATNPAEGWIEVDIPTRYAMFVRDDARVALQQGFISEIGIEDLSIGNVQHPGTGFAEGDNNVEGTAGFDASGSWLIRMSYVRDSWVSDVHSFRYAGNTTTAHMLSNGLSLVNCFRMTVRNTEMRRAQFGGAGGNGYMFRIQHTNEALIKDSVADFSRHGFVISHAGTSGNVFLRVEDRETARATGNTGSYNTSGSGSDHHMHFSHSNLIDQSHVHNSFFTAHHRQTFGTVPHGLTSAHTVFWNTSGSGTRGGSIVRSEQGRYGYIIGTSGSRSGASNAIRAQFPTGPADHVEGVGIGDRLVPQSLFDEQLLLRLEPRVTYVDNGATAGVAPVDPNSPFERGDLVTVLGPGNLQRTHFTFDGWNTEPDGSGAHFAPGATFEIDRPVTLYAQWLYVMRVDAGADQTAGLSGVRLWTPAFIETAAWFDAADAASLTLAAGSVSRWSDKSGNENHALQDAPAQRPTVGTASIGGLPTVSFRAGQQQHLTAADSASLNLDDTGGLNIFSVFNFHGWVDQGTALNLPLSKGIGLIRFPGYGILVSDDNRLGFKAAVDAEISGETGFVRRDLLFSGTRDHAAGTAHMFLQGRLVDSVTGAEAFVSDNTFPLHLGRDPSNARFTDVDFGEVLIIGGAMSQDDREQVEGYLAHKWGFAGSLPLNHGFRSSPPVVGLATVDLSATVRDGVGDSLTHAWSLVSGPAPVTFANPSALQTSVTFIQVGVYTLRLTSTDTVGSNFGELVVTVGFENSTDAFELWAGSGTLSFESDLNGDGVAEGLAWLLGASGPDENATGLLPVGLLNDTSGELELHFTLLNEGMRGGAPVNLFFSTDLVNWTSVAVPAQSGSANGVDFIINPNGPLNEVMAILPPGAGDGPFFVRVIGALAEVP